MTGIATTPIERAREIVTPALRDAVDRLAPRMRLIAGYQLGWWDGEGNATQTSGGKSLRPALAVVSAEIGGGAAADGVLPAVAVELVHNFSLVHDDIMDRDLERRHRPTAWVVFGEGQAILAGTAMLTLAVDVLQSSGEAGRRSLPALTAAIQGLINGQSDDLAFEGSDAVDLAACLQMEADKTAALLACSASIGALSVGAPHSVVDGLACFGYELGIAFQLVDDILGITGDPKITGKSSSSDVRARKRSAPVVAALSSETAAAAALAPLMAPGPELDEDDVARATDLIIEAGGLEWAAHEADEHLTRAMRHLERLPVSTGTTDDLALLAAKVVARNS